MSYFQSQPKLAALETLAAPADAPEAVSITLSPSPTSKPDFSVAEDIVIPTYDC